MSNKTAVNSVDWAYKKVTTFSFFCFSMRDAFYVSGRARFSVRGLFSK
jgi:hypothetical protein